MTLIAMFSDDAQANSANKYKALRPEKTQIDVLSSSWRCQAPVNMIAYRDSYKTSISCSLNF